MRSISHSEAATLLDCQAKHAFAYTGALTNGDALSPLVKHHRLREGTAWGMAMAHYHAGRLDAGDAMSASLRADEGQMIIPDQHEFNQMNTKLRAILDHYTSTAAPIGIDRQELKLDVSIPSRRSKRASTRYRFTGFVDGIHTTTDGDWIVEFKLRDDLSSVEQITKGRQIRWYAWAWRQATGRDVVGVIVDERKNEPPKPARIVKAKRKGEGIDGYTVSHAKDQMTTGALYLEACVKYGVDPEPETLAEISARRWQQREPVFLTDHEIEEAGMQLVSLANLAGQLDSGVLYPIKNPSQFRCPSCAFKDICNDPSDAELVDEFFTRNPPKKDRQEVAA